MFVHFSISFYVYFFGRRVNTSSSVWLVDKLDCDGGYLLFVFIFSVFSCSIVVLYWVIINNIYIILGLYFKFLYSLLIFSTFIAVKRSLWSLHLHLFLFGCHDTDFSLRFSLENFMFVICILSRSSYLLSEYYLVV